MNNEPEKLDLTAFARGMLQACRHLLIYGLILCVLLAGFFSLRSWRSYTPRYTASVTFTVQVANPLYSSVQSYNASTAEQMAKTFPYILTSGALIQQVQEELGCKSHLSQAPRQGGIDFPHQVPD